MAILQLIRWNCDRLGFSTKLSGGQLMIGTGGDRAIDAESAIRLLGLENLKVTQEKSAYQIWLVLDA